MNKKLLYILLLISLAFNLAFVGSYIYIHATRPHHEFSRHRGKDHDRRGWFPFEESDSTRALRDTFMLTKKELMQELAKDPINEPAIQAIIQRSLQAQAVLETDLGKRLLELRKKQSPQEAAQFFQERIKRMDERRNERRDNHKRRYRR